MANSHLNCCTLSRNENELLGRGCFGDVFGGTLTKRDESIQVAFKCTTIDSDSCELFDSLKRLNHLFVVKYYGIHREGQKRFKLL
jgi:hypothetical protein